MLSHEINAQRLVMVLVQHGALTSEDLRKQFEIDYHLVNQSFYNALKFCKERKWLTGGGRGQPYALSPTGAWKEPDIASIGESIGVSRDKDQLEYLVNSQSQQIGELQSENERLRDWSNGGDAGVALPSLVRIVGDSAASTRQRLKAATAVLGYQVQDNAATEFVKRFLESVCTSTEISNVDYRIEAGELLRKHESPRIASESVKPAYSDDSQANRAEMWRVYECWQLRKQIILETHQIPPRGYDAHLQRDTYAGPPEGTAMPPVRVVEDPTSGFRLLDNLMPGFAPHRTGRGTEDAEIRTNASLALLRSRGILQVE